MILYFCNHTASNDLNSGIQKVSRFTAKSLLKIGCNLLPVTIRDNQLSIINFSDLRNFSNYGGPNFDAWRVNNIGGIDLKKVKGAILPDLIYGNDFEHIINFCNENKIKLYTIFYDAVPIIFKDIYSKINHWDEAHENYMKKIGKYGYPMAISKSAAEQFKENTEENIIIKTISLPNNFIEGIGAPEKINDTRDIKIVFVSSIEGRKNHKTLMKSFEIAYNELKRKGYNLQLDLIGNSAPFWGIQMDIVRDAEKRLPVKWHQGQSDDQVLDFYRNADFTVYPSELEGFGLPIIESLFNNTPCIVANNSSLIEVGSLGGCVMFETLNEIDLANKIIEMSTNKELRHRLVEEIKNIPRYTWEDYAQNIIDYIEDEK